MIMWENMLVFSFLKHRIGLYVILFTFNLKYRSKCDCGDDVRTPTEGQDCCTNYHMINGVCEACPVGYFGNNCSVQCPNPSFGRFCGDICNCSQSDCNPALGCMKFELDTAMTLVSRLNTSLFQPATSSKKHLNTDVNTNRETDNDNQYVVALSVTLATCVIIVLAVVLTKGRSNTNGNVIYYIQSPEGCRVLSSDKHVPLRNPEVDIYMEIKELEAFSSTGCVTEPENERADALNMKLKKIAETV